MGRVVDTNSSAARARDRKASRGMALREEIFGLQPDSSASARPLLSSVPFLNFFRWIAPGGFGHLRHRRNVVNDSGILECWRSGASRVEPQVVVTGALRGDMLWRWRSLESRPAKRLHFADQGGFVWRPRLHG